MRPRSMEVLARLAARPGQVVSRSELFEAVWRGDAVEDGALARCISEIRSAVGDSPREPDYIETLTKRGYRLIAPVKLIELPPAAGRRSRFPRMWIPGALLPLAALLAALIFLPGPADEPGGAVPTAGPAGGGPSVAVLGFRNLSQDPELQWLSTALSEMLTTELAVSERLRALPADAVARTRRELVIADSGQLGPKERRQLHDALGADYVVLGTYLASPGEGRLEIRLDLRVQENPSGKIVTAVVETGTVKELGDLVLFAGLRLRRALGGGESLANRRMPPAAPLPASARAARLYFQGLLHLRRSEALEAARLLKEAVSEEPESPQPHFALAEAWTLLGHDARAMASATRALSLAADLPRETRLWMEARCHGLAGQWPQALERLRALRLLDPENLEYGQELVRALLSAGSTEEALTTVAALRGAGEAQDPRLSLLAARAAAQASDFDLSLEQAAQAREAARGVGATLVAGRALLLEAEALHIRGAVAEAEAAMEEARTLFDQAGDRRSAASARVTLAGWLGNQGDLEEAEKLAREALDVFRQIGYRAGEAEAQRRLAEHAWRQGRLQDGEGMYDRALATYREIGDRRGEARTLSSLAISSASYGTGPSRQGLRTCPLFAEALEIYRQIGDLKGRGNELNNLGRCAMLTGDAGEAAATLAEAVAVWRRIGGEDGLSTALFNLGHARSMAGDPVGAEAAFAEVIGSFRRLGNSRMLAASLVSLGGARMMAGNLAAAEEDLEEALGLARQVGDPVRVVFVLGALARLHSARGDHGRAEELARQGIALADGAPSPWPGFSARKELAAVLLEAGFPEQARAVVEGLEEALDPIPATTINGINIHLETARVLGASGDRDRARELLAGCLAFARSKGLKRVRLEAELALVEVELRDAAKASLRERLLTLEAQAHALGLALLATRARTLLEAAEEPGDPLLDPPPPPLAGDPAAE